MRIRSSIWGWNQGVVRSRVFVVIVRMTVDGDPVLSIIFSGELRISDHLTGKPFRSRVIRNGLTR